MIGRRTSSGAHWLAGQISSVMRASRAFWCGLTRYPFRVSTELTASSLSDLSTFALFSNKLLIATDAFTEQVLFFDGNYFPVGPCGGGKIDHHISQLISRYCPIGGSGLDPQGNCVLRDEDIGVAPTVMIFYALITDLN